MKKQIPFRPILEGDFKQRFYSAVKNISLDTPRDEILSLAEAEIDWVENKCFYNLEQRKKYRAIFFLLKDLISASYTAEFKDGILLLSLPAVSKKDIQDRTTSEVKNMLRGWMAESRHERIVAGKSFVNRMEKETPTKRPITCLIADGNELAERLLRARRGEIDLCDAVDPRLELVEEDKRDEGFSGQKLSEIWQYFRLTWSTAYETTPGRTVRYLIRDYAHPMHAVMGIASLENCTVQISTRDDYIGWTLEGFKSEIERLNEDKRRKAFKRLLNNLEAGIDAIDYSELCDKDAIKEPSLELINEISNIARDEEARRKKLLQSTEESEEGEKSQLGNISKAVEEALYKKKRAEQIAKLLTAKKTIQEFLEYGDVADKSMDFCNSDNGGSAIYSALIAQKSKHIGSSMMELNVCGAIPPYNHILGGKLVALLATSPQVIHDYKLRYKDRPSEIASRMKGEPVTRPADLVFLGTTSLYYVGSSQYNRLKIPGEVFDCDHDIVWKELGNTIGYGTMHISRATITSINEAVGEDSKLINHVFGEGASPKFRLLTMGVTKLLETDQDSTPKEFTKHAMSRIVYGACLAKNTKEYLLGYDNEPIYYTDMDEYESGTQKVIDFWRERWLRSRMEFEPIYDRMRSFKISDLLVSNEFKEDETVELKKLEEVSSMPTMGSKEKLNFVRGFYRGTSAFADNISDDLLKIIHVKTSLDDAIVEDVNSGKDVVLTGNAGDGKTHIIKILMPELVATKKNPMFMLDASEKSSEEIYLNWKKSREEGRPFVLAINAAVLFALYEYCMTVDPVFKPIEEAFDLMQKSITFHDEGISYDDVVVYDLNQRNVLDREMVKSAANRLSSDELFEECQACQFKTVCPAQRNRALINNSLFLDRLCFILNRVSIQGHHATLRDLQSLVSYLIFGDKKCSELSGGSGGDNNELIALLYDENAKGEIFRQIQNSFDPIKISHPVYDEMLLSNSISRESWSSGYSAPTNSISSTDIDGFKQRKRQFFFFNNDGSKYIEVNDDIVSRFEALLNNTSDKSIRKQIVRKLDCFFETEPSNDLVIWTGHRYDNQPRKVLLSVGSLSDNKFSIGRPKLQSDMQRGFSAAANYLRFERKISETENIFLKIDYGMFELLTKAENGVPVLFMESDLVKKVWRFVEQLQSMKDYEDEDRIDVSILDVKTREMLQLTIDCEDKQYSKVKIERKGRKG